LVDININDNDSKKIIYAGITKNPSRRLIGHLTGGPSAPTHEYRQQNKNADVKMIVIGKYENYTKASEDEYIVSFMHAKLSLVSRFHPGEFPRPLSPLHLAELENNTERRAEIEECVTDGIKIGRFVTTRQIIYCPTCGAMFSYFSSLAMHEKTHVKNKQVISIPFGNSMFGVRLCTTFSLLSMTGLRKALDIGGSISN
jgi:predicted GIY-YIG superfamily endonuclease